MAPRRLLQLLHGTSIAALRAVKPSLYNPAMAVSRLKSSLKGRRGSIGNISWQETLIQSDLAPVLEEMAERPLVELDLQLVSDDARSQFADFLGRVEGKKDIVIQPELMSLLDHVTPINFLKKYVRTFPRQ